MEGRSRGGRQVADNEWHFVLIRPVFGVAQNSDGSEGRGGERGRKFVMERGPFAFSAASFTQSCLGYVSIDRATRCR